MPQRVHSYDEHFGQIQSQSGENQPDDKPGKTRTWWHPLLVSILRHFLASGYVVTGEVLLGKMPLRADVVVVRREDGRVPEEYAQELRVIVERLNRWSLFSNSSSKGNPS